MAFSRGSPKEKFEESKQVGACSLSSTSSAVADCGSFGCEPATYDWSDTSSWSASVGTPQRAENLQLAQFVAWAHVGCSGAFSAVLARSTWSFSALSCLNRAKAYLAQIPHWVPTFVFRISSFQVATPSSKTQRLIWPSVTALQEQMYIGVTPSIGLVE